MTVLYSLFLYLVMHSSQLQEVKTNPIHIWYGPVQEFGHLGEPQPWINVLGSVENADQMKTVGYVLNGGSMKALTLGSDLHRLAKSGDFNVELKWDELQQGENQLVIQALSMDGSAYTRKVKLQIKRGNQWPIPYEINFSKVNNLQEAVQVVDGRWQLQPIGVRILEPYYDRVLCVGDTSWKNFEATVSLTIHGFTPSEPGPPTYNVSHFGIAMRWRGHHTDGRQPRRKWFPLGAQGEFLLKEQADSCRWRILFDGIKSKPPVYASKRNSIQLGKRMIIKTQVNSLPGGQTRYRFKQWMNGEVEPKVWDVEGLEFDDYPSGALCLVPHNSDVTIYKIKVIPL